MNYYFLVEDSKTFYYLLPRWLEYVDFGCELVEDINFVKNNNYILESGHGVTQLVTHTLYNALDTILDKPNIFDKLVLVVDAEDEGYDKRKQDIFNKINNDYLLKGIKIPCSIHIFVCNRCIETWLLGCSGIYPKDKKNMKSDFIQYYDFYNINDNDPEKMGKPSDYKKTIASYHYQYLHALTQDIAEKRHKTLLTYRKKQWKLGCVSYQEYFNSMINRIETTEDIISFKEFYNFIISEKKNNK
jgi:hypothetical protein